MRSATLDLFSHPSRGILCLLAVLVWLSARSSVLSDSAPPLRFGSLRSQEISKFTHRVVCSSVERPAHVIVDQLPDFRVVLRTIT